MKNHSIVQKIVILKILFLILSTSVLAQTVIINDPLQGSTVGTQIGGNLTSEGFSPRIGKYYKSGVSEDHILYNVGRVIENGYIEFQIKGFDMNDFEPTSSSLPSRENGFIVLYDGRGVPEPLQYSPDAKHNYFYWVIHYRSEKYQSTAGNKWKAIINCAEPRSERINSSRAVFDDATGDFGLVQAKDGVLNILDRDWTVEPNGLRTNWDPNKWYTMKIEWNNNQFKVFLDDVMVWFNELEEGQPWTSYDNSTPQAVYPWKPLDLKIWLGSAPGRYDNDMKSIVYRNFKVVDYNNTPPSRNITITSPNGGEALIVGSSYSIRWYSSLVTNVKIDYSSDYGINWNSIVNSTNSDGLYSWLVPNDLSSECLIRIQDLDSLEINDVSNGVFTIREESTDTNLVILSPNGGEEWLIGENNIIKWNAPMGTNNVTIFYSSDYDFSNTTQATWTTIGTTSNSGSYNWIVPNTPSNSCVVRIKDIDNYSNVDISDSLFIIRDYSPLLSLVSPRGGEQLQPNMYFDINWNSMDVNMVKLEYSVNNGIDWLLVVDSLFNQGNYYWLVPNNSSDSCLVKITDLQNNSIVSVSDSLFSINKVTIRVISPNGGENLFEGNDENILWESENVANVVLEYSVNNGSSWQLITDSTNSNGAYNWTIPNFSTNECLIRIFSLKDSTIIDLSDSTFSIQKKMVSLTLLKPNGGEEWGINNSEQILWNSENVENVRISYSLNSGSEWFPIVDSTLSDGSFDWVIPNSISDSCRIKIASLDDSTVFSISEDLFSIVDLTNANTRNNEIPRKYSLMQNYPNPFNPSTIISYAIPKATNVKIIVYNILGKKIKNLINKYQSPGYYKVNFQAQDIPSGIYLYRIQAGNFNKSLTMLLLK